MTVNKNITEKYVEREINKKRVKRYNICSSIRQIQIFVLRKLQ